MLERTLSLSMYEIPNLEIISKNELLKIHDYLLNIYGPSQLLPFDAVHLFKLLRLTKMSIVGINQSLAFLLKIPILKPFVANYSTIYPLPNNNDLIILPPKKHLIRLQNAELWTNEDCREIGMVNICLQQPVEELCSIRNFEKCTIAKVTNGYEITYVLKNKQLLFVSKRSKKIIEDCQGILTTHEAQ